MTKYIYLLTLAILVSACSGKSELEEKKEAHKALKSQAAELQAQIKDMEKEIMALDSTFGKAANNKVLVTSINIQPQYFEHKIEVRGAVESRTNVNVSTQIPGEIKSVAVKEGDYVKKGQTLLMLDDEITRNNIAELQTALDLATIVFGKQTNLWNKNIGTEIQYLEAKNNKESLERRLATAKSQLKQFRVTAPFSGSIDAVSAKAGEMAQPGMELVRIVNPNDIHIKADVSERFIGKFKKGDDLDVYFPSQQKRIVSTIKSVGQVINSQNRTFEVEIKLPSLPFPVKPNQVVVLNMRDYSNETAIKLPTKLIQRDNKGNYVYELIKEKGKTVAKKLHVVPGVSFKNETEILEGVSLNQNIAFKGYRELSEGVVVSLIEEGQQGADIQAASN
ncbi:MAG: efflux RND transporter periplasmic adaptor subunit [Reichenbachiella sp.]|uniref:efflux RND transporter periplasmic adaptor subunit n=2 Tax=Reichenbachiella sp. TaxID=2184521 RepID=UPI003267AC0C